jgi:hypothetical protein
MARGMVPCLSAQPPQVKQRKPSKGNRRPPHWASAETNLRPTPFLAVGEGPEAGLLGEPAWAGAINRARGKRQSRLRVAVDLKGASSHSHDPERNQP